MSSPRKQFVLNASVVLLIAATMCSGCSFKSFKLSVDEGILSPKHERDIIAPVPFPSSSGGENPSIEENLQ